MKKLIILLIAFLPLGVFAQEAKIAYVNVADIFNNMPEVGNIEKQLMTLQESLENELKIMQEEYQRKTSAFISQQDSLQENIKLRRMQEIEDIRTRMENFVPVAQQDIENKRQELMQPLQEKIHNAIKAVGDEKGYTYILNPQIFLYTGNSAVDATSFVKTKLGI